jgi:hypothetical protein
MKTKRETRFWYIGTGYNMSHFQMVTVAVSTNPTPVPIRRLRRALVVDDICVKLEDSLSGVYRLQEGDWCKLVFIFIFDARYPTCFAFSLAHLVSFLGSRTTVDSYITR